MGGMVAQLVEFGGKEATAMARMNAHRFCEALAGVGWDAPRIERLRNFLRGKGSLTHDIDYDALVALFEEFRGGDEEKPQEVSPTPTPTS
jgi:hypothetical protein